jgi:hypothetical protein
MCPLHSAVTCGLSRRVESVQLVAVQQEVGWADGEKIVRKHLEALLSNNLKRRSSVFFFFQKMVAE